MIDLTTQRFGRLLVLRREGVAKNGTGTAPTWCCRCDCGTEVVVPGPSLRRGQSRSCGCLTRKHDAYTARHNKPTPEYSAWSAMISRCTNPKCASYRSHGARGIRVCERWQTAANFLADMGPRPSPHHSLDRIDNNGHYEPSNCRWATREQQHRNKRNNHVLTVGGLALPISAWSERTGLSPTTIRMRMERGWSAERAVNTPA